MINALIVDDDLRYVKYILNLITSNFKNINICHIATDGEEALNEISSNHLDLIFLDLKMPTLSGDEVIKRTNKLNCITRPKFIIISGDMPSLKELGNCDNIKSIINKLESPESICKKIEYVINEINYNVQLPFVKDFVISELLNFGYDFKLKGTSYIMEAILYIYSNNNMDLLDNLEQNVLKPIAFSNEKTLHNIQTSITKATIAIKRPRNTEMKSKSVITFILIQIFNKFN